MNDLQKTYQLKEKEISKRLSEFKSLSEDQYFPELMFCLLTPQSKAKSCWEAIQEINLLKKFDSEDSSNPQDPKFYNPQEIIWDKEKIREILSKKTRFHNNKTNYLMLAKEQWPIIKQHLSNTNRKELRNWLTQNIKGIGLKESAHFLRNIGKSDNQVSILDRHILRNLESLGLINDQKIKSNKHYLEIENSFLGLAKKLNIPADHLDLILWSNETGEVFK